MLGAACRFDPLPRSEATTRNSLVSLVLRLGLGAIFIYHGWNKLDIERGGWGATWTASYWDKAIGHPMPEAMSYLWLQVVVAWGEFLGGIALVIGLFTRIAALGMIAIQAGAISMVTYALGFRASGGGWEYNAVLIAGCLALFIAGGGVWSLDQAILRSDRKAAAQTQKTQEPGVFQPV